LTTSTGYVSQNGTTRKFRMATQAALTVGPALIVVARYLLTLLPVAVPAAVSDAIATVIEAGVVLATTYYAAPGADDTIAPADQPAPVPSVVPPAPAAPQAVYSAVPADAPLAPRAQ
jgi:hypothetical protein